MISVSVSEANSMPSAWRRERSAGAFSTMPLCTTAIEPSALTCGWALASVGAPWVAHRVCPMPSLPPGRFGSTASSWASLPAALCTRTAPPETRPMPAES